MQQNLQNINEKLAENHRKNLPSSIDQHKINLR